MEKLIGILSNLLLQFTAEYQIEYKDFIFDEMYKLTITIKKQAVIGFELQCFCCILNCNENFVRIKTTVQHLNTNFKDKYHLILIFSFYPFVLSTIVWTCLY